MIPHNQIVFANADKQLLHDVVQSGFFTQGKYVADFEAKAANFYQRKCATAVSSGSMAIRLALILAGVKAGSNVIVPAYLCSAVCNSVLSLGANVIPCDIAEGEANIDVYQAIQLAEQHRANVVIVVNTFGIPADITTLKHAGLTVVEDCSHGFAITADSLPQTYGDFVIQSLYATKLLGAAELGVVLFDDEALLGSAKRLREGYSQIPSGECINMKANEFSGALGVAKLVEATSIIAQRQARANIYLGNKFLSRHVVGNVNHRVWYRFVISVEQADKLIDSVASRVQILRPISPWLNNLNKFPHASTAYRRYLSLPIYPSLEEEDQTEVMSVLDKYLQDTAL